MHKITFCFQSCGEETSEACLQSISSKRHLFNFQEVINITPAVKALNQMIDQVQSKFLVPLDADFILNDNFFERINKAIDDNEEDSKWHSILFSLWDTLTQEKIYALKILRTSILKDIMFKDTPCPDIQHYKDLTDAGYHAIDKTSEEPIGNHVVKGNYFCYAKYRDLYMIHRVYPKTILEKWFKGGNNINERSFNHFEFFNNQYLKTFNKDYLYCIAGMLDGLISPIDYKSKDLSKKNMNISVNGVKENFLNWHLKNKNLKIFV